MDKESELNPRDTVDILLDHQAQRLEDIANNAVEFIRINLFILGAFMPFLATVITDVISPETFIDSRFSKYVVASWLISTVVATFVYKIARTRSMSHFDTLEKAVVNNWRDADLRDEMIDNNDDYDGLTTRLMVGMTISIAFSLMTILFLGLGISDPLLEFSRDTENEYIFWIIAVSAAAGIGIEFTSVLLRTHSRMVTKAHKLGHQIGRRLQEFTSFTLRLPFLSIRFSKVKEDEPFDYEEYIWSVLESEGLSPIRIRLLKAIRESMGLEAWSFGELAESLRENSPEIGVTRGMINRLLDRGYIQRVSSEGPSTFVLHERRGEMIGPDNLDKAVGDELGRLIGDIRQNQHIRDVVASELGINSNEVEDRLVDGSTADRMEKLNSSVEAIRDSFDMEFNYGKIEFRNSADRYQLTPKAIRPFSLAQLKRGEQAYEEGLYAQASVLASKALESYLRSIYLRGSTVDSEEARQMGIGSLLDVLEEAIFSRKEIDMLNQLREIRNQAVHSQETQLEEKEVQKLLSIAETIMDSDIPESSN